MAPRFDRNAVAALHFQFHPPTNNRPKTVPSNPSRRQMRRKRATERKKQRQKVGQPVRSVGPPRFPIDIHQSSSHPGRLYGRLLFGFESPPPAHTHGREARWNSSPVTSAEAICLRAFCAVCPLSRLLHVIPGPWAAPETTPPFLFH